jgi:hypothetical protein
VLALSLALAIYLPTMEVTGPLKRLTAEFNAMRNGTQQQLFYDTYGNGPVGELAKAAHQYHEALRTSLQAADGRRRGRRPQARVAPRPRRQQTPLQPPHPAGPEDRRPALRAAAVVDPHPAAAPPRTRRRRWPTRSSPRSAGSSSGRGAGFFTMPATKPLRSRETVIGNLMTLDNDPNAPEPAKDDAVREAYYQEVFEEFVKFKVENNESIDNFTYDKFATKLRANTAELMKRPDVKDVQFSVYIKDGKVALKARVVRVRG